MTDGSSRPEAPVRPHSRPEDPAGTLGTRAGPGSALGPPERASSSGLVQEPPGQVATPEARVVVRAAPIRTQKAPEGGLLRAPELPREWRRPLGPARGAHSPTFTGRWEKTPAANPGPRS